MRIFVTGGSGFLGTRLVRQLLRDGHHVCCLVRPGSDIARFRAAVEADAAEERFDVVRGSLARLAGAVATATRGCDTVIHAAAATTGGAPALFLTNVVATRSLIGFFSCAGIKRFILVSSLGVYGAGALSAGDVLDETCPLDPEPHRRDAYSYSKHAQERVAWEAHATGALPLVVIRPGVIYGPGRGSLSARIGLRLGRVMVRMGGRQQVPYTYVDNCAAAIAAAVVTPGIEGQAFNVVDDELPTALYVLWRYRRDVERLRVVPLPRWSIGPVSRLCHWCHDWSGGQLPAVLTRYRSAAQWGQLRYSNAKAKSVLRWRPAVSFEEGLRRTAEWSREQMGRRESTSASPVPVPQAAAQAVAV